MADAAQPGFTVDGHRLTPLVTGPERLRALIALIDGAEHSLRLLFYIFVDDAAGRRVRDALVAARGRGVAVSLTVDGMGSHPAANDDFFDGLRNAGGDVCRFIPRLGRRFLLRNHQKLAIADAEGSRPRTIVGGFNIQDVYFDPDVEGAWRDLGLVVEGAAGARLAAYYDALTEWMHARASFHRLRRVLARHSEREGPLRWLLGGPTRRLSPWARGVRDDMRRAAHTDIVAGYFAPSPTMLRRLDRRGIRGRVRIVLAQRSDNPAALWAARFTYRGLLKRGVELHEYRPEPLHTKLYVIDDVVHIGSANFDVRSLFLNLELMLRIEDAAFAAHMRAYVEGEIADSDSVTLDRETQRTNLWMRAKQFGAYFVMAVVDPNVSRRLNFGDES